jgi:branched-chain amino acid transport system ATP-binding protein
VLEVNDLNVYYGSIHAVKGVSFHVKEREIVAILGSNGAGKTTILKTIAGVLKAKEGNITFCGENLSKAANYKIVKSGISLIPEGRHVFPKMTVVDNLLMGAYTRWNDKKGNLQTIEYIFDIFPRLKERKNQLAGTLSGGEQQMLTIGRALMSKPKMLMLDEPSLGLAPIIVSQIFEMIKSISETGTTILLVEQNAHMALKIADRGYVVETGRIIMEGSSEDLRNNERVKEAYL